LTAKRQIIALGGGGFSEDRDHALDRYLLEQTGAPRPAITFIGTASGDSERYHAKFYAAFARLECRMSHLTLFGRAPDVRKHIAEQDIVFVGGGNTKSMLAVWREWGLPELLREAWQRGTLLCGTSAGAICWFEQGVTDAAAAGLGALDCLGLLPGSCCPHYDGEAERRPAYQRLVSSGEVPPGIAIDDGAAVHFVDDKPWRVVSPRPDASAYRVECAAGTVTETSLTERLQLAPD